MNLLANSNISVVLCASSVFSVPPWWKTAENTHHRDTENTRMHKDSELEFYSPLGIFVHVTDNFAG